MRFKVIAHGVAAHSSVPQQGKSAISAMARAIPLIESQYIDRLTATHPLTGKAVSSINLIRGGTQVNIIPDHCEVEIDRRLVPGEDPDDVTATLRSVVESIPCEPGVRLAFERCDHHGTLSPDASAPLLPNVQSVLEEMSLPTEPAGAPFCTHAAVLSQAGVRSLVIGPGNPYPAHTKDEYIDLDQLHAGVTFYKGLMEADWGEQ